MESALVEQVVEQVRKLLENADESEVTVFCPAVEVAPVNGRRTYKPGPTKYLVVRVGPEDVPVDNCIRAKCGIDPMNFKK